MMLTSGNELSRRVLQAQKAVSSEVNLQRAGVEPSWPVHRAWAVGVLELLCAVMFVGWFLTLPAVFKTYYPALQDSHRDRDAEAVVRWLSTSHRERTLNLSLVNGRFGPKELRHYSDVRRVFAWFPKLALIFGLSAGAVLFWGRPSRQFVTAAHKRAAILWLVLVVGTGAVAWWDWSLFFGWLHEPLFGSKSWRLSKDAYSLQLFPTSFWRNLTALGLLGPLFLLGFLAAVTISWPSQKRSSSPTSSLPSSF